MVLCLSDICVFLAHRCFSFIQPGNSFSPFFSKGGSFGEVGTPTIVSQNKKEARDGGREHIAHPLLIDFLLSCRSTLFCKV